MGNKMVDSLLVHNPGIKSAMERLLGSIESESSEQFLEILLKLMKLVFILNPNGFRRNIEGFSGRYLFRSSDDSITVSAIFDNGVMTVEEGKIDRPDIAVTFRNGKALMNFILSPKPDILGAMLRQDVTLVGNLNYLYKFAYMAKRLQLMAAGKV